MNNILSELAEKFRVLVKKYYYHITGSIAFTPSIIAVVFTIGVLLLLWFDSSDLAPRLKDFLVVIEFRDPITARNIAITLLAGILSLTVFSFSMVMVMLGQTMSNSSPKIMDMLIQEKSQQIILGCFIGTILYCLILALNIRDFKDTTRVPDFSFFVGILLGVFNIFLFIYFINSIAQNIKPKNFISQIHQTTKKGLAKLRAGANLHPSGKQVDSLNAEHEWFAFNSPESGYLQDIDGSELISLTKKYDAIIKIEVYFGTYVIQGTPILSFNKPVQLDEKEQQSIHAALEFYTGESVGQNFNYGFQQLMEIAIKALSPGINDPGTALLCIDSLSDCLASRMQIKDKPVQLDDNGEIRLITKPVDLDLLLHISFGPIRYYGRSDTRILTSLLETFAKLSHLDKDKKDHQTIFNKHSKTIIEVADHHIEIASERKFINALIDKMNEMDDYFKLDKLKM